MLECLSVPSKELKAQWRPFEVVGLYGWSMYVYKLILIQIRNLSILTSQCAMQIHWNRVKKSIEDPAKSPQWNVKTSSLEKYQSTLFKFIAPVCLILYINLDQMNRVVYSLNSQVVEETANLPKLESLYKTLIPKQKARLKPKSTQNILTKHNQMCEHVKSTQQLRWKFCKTAKSKC